MQASLFYGAAKLTLAVWIGELKTTDSLAHELTLGAVTERYNKSY